MNKLTFADLLSLEDYHKQRGEFRARVLAHKKNRQVGIGANATLYFEDRLTVMYQVQEMLRIERLFESEAIDDELQAYNPLVPDGNNLKATFMLEFPDAEERRRELQRLTGIEDTVFVQVAGEEKVFAIADEDLDRSTAEKTSAVHFLRFELNTKMAAALRGGEQLGFGITHPNYSHTDSWVPEKIRDSLLADLD
jgi:hypothetical protein